MMISVPMQYSAMVILKYGTGALRDYTAIMLWLEVRHRFDVNMIQVLLQLLYPTQVLLIATEMILVQDLMVQKDIVQAILAMQKKPMGLHVPTILTVLVIIVKMVHVAKTVCQMIQFVLPMISAGQIIVSILLHRMLNIAVQREKRVEKSAGLEYAKKHHNIMVMCGNIVEVD